MDFDPEDSESPLSESNEEENQRLHAMPQDVIFIELVEQLTKLNSNLDEFNSNNSRSTQPPSSPVESRDTPPINCIHGPPIMPLPTNDNRLMNQIDAESAILDQLPGPEFLEILRVELLGEPKSLAAGRSSDCGTLPKLGNHPIRKIEERRACFKLVASFGRLPVFLVMLFMDEDGQYYIREEPERPKRENQRGEMVHFYVLQQMIASVIQKNWASGWKDVLDSIDRYIKVEIKDVLDAEGIKQLMFDNSESFARSHTCWLLLHLLRVSSEWINETKRDIQFLWEQNTTDEELNWHARGFCSRDEYEAVGKGWEWVSRQCDVAEKKLQDRIAVQVAELKGMRDSLFSATSLLEASRTTRMNRYIIIFTVLTIIYLPLGFVTAVFSAPLTQEKGWTQAKSQYAITTIAVAVGTYIIAGALLLFVDRKKKVAEYMSEKATSWQARLTNNTRRKAASVSAAAAAEAESDGEGEGETKAKAQEITISGIFQALHTMARKRRGRLGGHENAETSGQSQAGGTGDV
ncbi:hypothetical protein B0T19DRAFT_475823 [Cercophora scortea]|uniref:Uncharacterized protein n=1 Tax=Cercophora scortea TaxID=314031 RepID=A0AAE0INB7_9PEZI|nr:hypothetical protein B0T19DRAFT_475823 [Cercophora scortea]